MTINERVGNNIRKYRIAHHYTLKDLSHLYTRVILLFQNMKKEFFLSVLRRWKNSGRFFIFPLRIFLSAPSEGKPDVSRKSLLKNTTCTIMMAEENEL